VHRSPRPEYARAWHDANSAAPQTRGLRPAPLAPRYVSPLDREYRLVLAGSAGGKVRSAARLVAEAALLSGLWAAQQDDYPVTVQTGHSISELILSPHEILFTGVTRPDALIVATEEGRRAATRYLHALTPESILFVLPEHCELATPARKVVLDPGASGIRAGRKQRALIMLLAAIRRLDILPFQALEEAICQGRRADVVQENLEAFARSSELA
jgi:Pyruvate/2-oxoacid:ferredoxin oxidoreductase gamma subunit